ATNETIGWVQTAGDLTIDGTELSHITAATLVLGSGTTTGITVDGITALQSGNIGLISLNRLPASSSISFPSHDSAFVALTATATAGISVQTNLTTSSTLYANADSDADGTGTFTVASTTTVSTTGHALNITAADVDLQ